MGVSKIVSTMLKEFYPQRYTICETFSNQSWLDKSLTEISEILADCVCPACENTVVQDTDLLCAHMTENINQNQNTIWMKITQNSLYMGLGIALIHILGILSVIIFLAVRKRCRNRKAQNLNKMKQTWLDECERASIAASNMNLISPRSVRTMTPALCQPPTIYAAGDYELPLAGSHLPRPNKHELKRTLSTRSVGPQYFTDPIQYQAPARPLRQPTTPRRLFVHEE